MNPYLRIAVLSLGLWGVITLLSSAVTGFPIVNPISRAIGLSLDAARYCDEIGWHVGRYVSDQVYIAWDVKTWPTARDAMAALEEQK